MFLVNKLRNQGLAELQDMLGGGASWADTMQRPTSGHPLTDIRQVADKPRRRGQRWEDFVVGFLGGPAAAEMLAARRAGRQSGPFAVGADWSGMAAMGGEAGRGLDGPAPGKADQLEESEAKPMPLAGAKMLGDQSETQPRYSWWPSSRPQGKPTPEEIERWRRRQMVPNYVPPRPGKPGYSQQDPIYDQIETPLEEELGLPRGILHALRTRGERSRSDQVSENGARTVYQIVPNTRRLFFDGYGVDAYEGPKEAARVAALHLLEDWKRNGNSWNDALTRYHGGPDRRQWGRRTRAYQPRTGDFDRP